MRQEIGREQLPRAAAQYSDCCIPLKVSCELIAADKNWPESLPRQIVNLEFCLAEATNGRTRSNAWREFNPHRLGLSSGSGDCSVKNINRLRRFCDGCDSNTDWDCQVASGGCSLHGEQRQRQRTVNGEHLTLCQYNMDIQSIIEPGKKV